MSESAPNGVTGVLNTKYAGLAGKWWILLGGVTTVGGYYIYKRSSAAGTDSTSGTSGTDAPDPNAIDPTTGLSYSEEEEDATNYEGTQDAYGQSGYDNGYSATGTGVDGTGYEDELLGEISSEIVAQNQHATTTSAPTDKGWATGTIDALVKAGYSRAAATAAVGAYLAGLPITEHQEGIIEAGIALNGVPPKAPPKPTIVKKSPPHATQKKPPVKKPPVKRPVVPKPVKKPVKKTLPKKPVIGRRKAT